MLRTKLILAFATCLAVVFVMAALLFWGPDQITRTLDRSLLAHRQAAGYLRLSSDAYRHFWQLADQLIAADEAGDASRQSASRARLRSQLEELEQLTIEEIGLVGSSEPGERQELLQIKQLADAIAAGVVAFNRVLDDAADPLDRAARLALLHQKIERDFSDLIEVAIADEQSETQAADERVRSLAGQLSSAAALFAIVGGLLVGGIGWWLLRGIQRPIELLLEGTRQVASGNLGHRIRLEGRDELAHLAASFNRMAGDLEVQRAALMRAQAGLEQKVRERTGELEQANLTLQRLDEVRRRMFADISHELRTPLTIISGEAEVTLRSRSAGIADYRTALGRIVDLSGQVARLVEDLMLLARSDSAALQIRRRPVPIETVLREAAEDLRALAHGHRIELAVRVPAGASHTVDADPARLAQLLLILVDNACRYTGAGGRIGVALEATASQAVLQVEDSGIGIPPHEAGAVFDRYFRGEQARRMAPKGQGLGLHVARTIAEAHGGSLAIDSAPGGGTTVTLSLPLLQRDPEEACRSC